MARLSSPSPRHLHGGLRASVLIALWAAVAALEPLLTPGASLAKPGLAEVSLGDPVPVAVPLRCRVGKGPWQGCAMEVEQPGARWTLVVGGRRIGFRHDGSGTVHMQDPARGSRAGRHDSGWIPVETVWIAGPALCWNGVCAQGDIPLD